jgi:organic radical activating enzyme
MRMKKMKKIDPVIQYEIDKLKEIGSTKDPIQFLAMRNFVNDHRTMNRSIILNFSDDGKHGCRFNCSFCSWKDREEVTRDLTPSSSNVSEFLKGYEGYKVTLSGGGDPLYEFTKNWTRLIELIQTINDEGFIVDIVTKELDIILKFHKILNPWIAQWNFSEEVKNPKLLEVLKLVPFARVSKIFNRNNPNNIQNIINYIEYYKDYATKIYIREDFNDRCYNEPRIIGQLTELHKTYGDKVVFLPNSVCSYNYFLVGNEIRIDQDTVKVLI